MKKLVTWVNDNKEWLFSGVGAVVAGWVVRLFAKNKSTSSTQTIRSGDNSINITAGRDVNIGANINGTDLEEQ